jgi:hypothetical protein
MMNQLSDALMRIMDFPNDLGKAYHEAQNNNKLRNTYMIVNGSLMLVRSFDVSSNVVVASDKMDSEKNVQVKTLDLWLPETGIYEVDNYPTFLYRVPQKQWRKSFSWDFYAVKPVGKSPVFCNNAFKLFEKNPEQIAMVDERIYFYTTPIAELVKSKFGTMYFKYLNASFAQELDDYIKERGLPWKLM